MLHIILSIQNKIYIQYQSYVAYIQSPMMPFTMTKENPSQVNPALQFSDLVAFQLFNNTYANALINVQLSSKSRFEAITSTRNIGQKSSETSRIILPIIAPSSSTHRVAISAIFPNRNCFNVEIDASN